jgi:predicted ferric reductase
MTIIKKYPAKVVAIHNKIEGVYTVDLVSLGKPFKYEPGQFLHLALDEYDPAGQWPDSRCFSIQSSPGEDQISITYAVKGQYTIRMQKELFPGKEITLKLPYGDLFSQDHVKINTVFISGGTGITPFLSLFTSANFSNYEKPVLYAGFRNEAMNLYTAHLKTANIINNSLEVHYIYQDRDGILDIEKIFNTSDRGTSFFISGPPVMIRTFKDFLIKQGMKTDQIKTDDWE